MSKLPKNVEKTTDVLDALETQLKPSLKVMQ